MFNLNDYRDLMGEAVTAVVTEGKAEADAWMTATIMRAGLDSLQARTSSQVAELPPSTAEAAEEG